jgi:phosphomannomutase
VIFDLDGTLASSKSRIGDSTAALPLRLMEHVDVAISSGGTFELFDRQVVRHLSRTRDLSRLHLLPTCGTSYYRWVSGNWQEIYSEPLAASVRRHVAAVLTEGVRDLGLCGG